jgi:hypothetical protein
MDDPPRYLDDDRDRRRGPILVVAAVVLVGVGTIVGLLGIPWWIVVGFVVLVFLGVLFST